MLIIVNSAPTIGHTANAYLAYLMSDNNTLKIRYFFPPVFSEEIGSERLSAFPRVIQLVRDAESGFQFRTPIFLNPSEDSCHLYLGTHNI